ncbi:uncharacterized protein KY384_000283 [Bacidia gigantensis]|uniref:uncharacterized protein n=1 Tax=Bacidia gigantensis TaxID=2732470 RepID=UPI001D0454C1|nr:uncharacterized protein KY384_000283 [Bacidia gigantensis]KAG8526290.1 hypothetical protein KY384_000283 [Bacidia gigantensis]
MMGPGLGGGFGRYQGYFGLVLDNILEMDVVIADGSKITVSASSHPELFWGMRGAGHNFGIVTRFQQKIFDNPNSKWFFATLVFRADKLEALIEVLNVFGANGTQPKEATTYTLFAVNPEISPSEPVIIFTLEYGGSASSAAPILAPFYAIDPVITTNTTVPYTEAAHAAGAGLEDPPCQPLSSWKLFPVGLQTFNIRTTRALYELFSTMIAENPAFNNSIVQLEGYPQQGVRAVDPDSTAYAHRDDILLASLGAVWPPNRPELENIAVQYGHQARTLLHAGDTPGRPLNTYVNYASSDETPEMLYGHEPWRLKRLRALKRKYDPNGRFNFYNPII